MVNGAKGGHLGPICRALHKKTWPRRDSYPNLMRAMRRVPHGDCWRCEPILGEHCGLMRANSERLPHRRCRASAAPQVASGCCTAGGERLLHRRWRAAAANSDSSMNPVRANSERLPHRRCWRRGRDSNLSRVAGVSAAGDRRRNPEPERRTYQLWRRGRDSNPRYPCEYA